MIHVHKAITGIYKMKNSFTDNDIVNSDRLMIRKEGDRKTHLIYQLYAALFKRKKLKQKQNQ